VRWLVLLALLCLPAQALCGGAEVLRVGTSGDYPPFSKRGKGFDIEVAHRLADDLGMRLVFVDFDWPKLSRRIGDDAFDVAMSGVTWRARRAVVGRMTRAVAAGGPCWIGAADPASVAVNRGGVLERWALGRFPKERVRAVPDNLTLPVLLANGSVEAIVTDSFEAPHFARPGQAVHCEPRVDRKVYWVAPDRARDLYPRIERWLVDHEAEIDALRREWFGQSAPRDEIDHLVDLLARRLAVMPHVAAAKQASGTGVPDPAREQVVLDAAASRAGARGLDPDSVRSVFAVQIELAKAIQGRAPAPAGRVLDLGSRLRPLISRLGTEIVLALARVAPLTPADLEGERLAPVSAWLEPEEVARLQAALLAIRSAR